MHVRPCLRAAFAVAIASGSDAATPEENARLANELFAPIRKAGEQYAQSQRDQANAALAVALAEREAQLRRELAQEETRRAVEVERLRSEKARQLADAEREFQVDLERRKAERAKREAEQRAPAPNAIPQIKLDDLVSSVEQHQAGLEKLSPNEREHLAATLTKKVAAAYTAGYMAGQSTPRTEKASSRTETRSAQLYAAAGDGHWLSKNIANGEMLRLEDGSLWEVSPLDRLDSSLWLPMSDIVVRHSDTGRSGYDYMLVNTDDGERVHAKLVGSR